MKMTIKTLELKDFKGISKAMYEFANKTDIQAENGTGKSTLVDAWLWLMVNKDYELNDNPDIRPNDGRECIPTVTAVIDVNGKEVILTKMQKKTVKADNTIALTNSFEVNGIEYGLKSYKDKLDEYGISFDKFLPLSHPDSFLLGMENKKERDNIRKILFSMVSGLTDADIVAKMDDVSDVAAMLDNYTLEEIEAMQKNSLRKINEDYGKDGEIIDAEIRGMEASKQDIDVAEVELQIKTLEKMLADCRGDREIFDMKKKEISEMQAEIMSLKFEQTDLVCKANEENMSLRNKLQIEIDAVKSAIDTNKTLLKLATDTVSTKKANIESLTNDKKKLLEKWQQIKTEEFDESTTICPTCGQNLPQEKIDSLKEEYLEKKNKRLKDIEDKGKEINETINFYKDDIQERNIEIEKLENTIETGKTTYTKLKKQLDDIPDNIDVTNTDEYKEYDKKMATLEDKIKKLSESTYDPSKENELNKQLVETKNKLAISSNNLRIDEEIAKLQDKKLEMKESQLYCKKILNQLSEIAKAKNEMLSEQINSHFDIVKWRLFTYQKNGECKDDCTPMIDGKLFGNHTNGALKTLAKLDIIKGLQRFFDESYPVFIDNYEHVTENTRNRVNPDCQLITLTARDGIRELTIC